MATVKASPAHGGGRVRKAVDVIDERLGIRALEYPVPEHANNLAWTLGGITAFAFMLLIITGVLLVQFYSPVPETANQSVRDMVANVWGMRFVRALHFWAAQAMYVTAALHMMRVYFTGSYKRPREANWLIGVTMFALVLLALFTGTVLKWDQEGFEALGHNVEVADLLGGVGVWFSPEFASRIPILVRLYGAHVVIIPGLILVLLTVHGLLVKRHRISPHPDLPTDATGDQAPSSEPTEPFTHHLRRIGALGLTLTGLLGVLAVLAPPAIGPAPVEGLEITRPPWNFWWMFTLEDWMGLSGILYGGGTLFLLLALVPFIDRNPKPVLETPPDGHGSGAARRARACCADGADAVHDPHDPPGDVDHARPPPHRLPTTRSPILLGPGDGRRARLGLAQRCPGLGPRFPRRASRSGKRTRAGRVGWSRGASDGSPRPSPSTSPHCTITKQGDQMKVAGAR